MKESDATTAILERLERIVESLQDNSSKMGQLLAVHDEKLDKQNKIDDVLFEKIKRVEEKLDTHAESIKKGCERDIRLVDNRLRVMEKKMWSIAGALTIISFVVSPMGQKFLRGMLTPTQESVTMNSVQSPMSELS